MFTRLIFLICFSTLLFVAGQRPLSGIEVPPSPNIPPQITSSVIKRQSPMELPGKGLAQHDFFYAGEAKAQDMYIVRKGQVVWSYHDATTKGEISDAVLMSNRNILFAHQFGVTEITPDKKVVWNYEVPSKYEVHTARPIGKDRVLLLQNGENPNWFWSILSPVKPSGNGPWR